MIKKERNKTITSIKDIYEKYDLGNKNNVIHLDNDSKFKKYFIKKYSMILNTVQENTECY